MDMNKNKASRGTSVMIDGLVMFDCSVLAVLIKVVWQCCWFRDVTEPRYYCIAYVVLHVHRDVLDASQTGSVEKVVFRTCRD